MRIALAAFGHAASGMEVGALDAALGLAERGVDVVLLADGDARLPRRADPLRDAVLRMPPRPAALTGPRREDALFLAAKLWRARSVARVMRHAGAHVLHAYSPGLAAMAPADVSVVAQAWMMPPDLRGRLRVMLPFARGGPALLPANVLREAQAQASDRLGYRRADLVLAATASATLHLRAGGIAAQTVPPPIVAPEAVTGRPPRRGLHIAFCGSPLSRRRKGLALLLDALALCDPQRMTVTLFGRPDAATDARVRSLRDAGLDVRTPGHVPREVYLAALRDDVDVLAFPSLYEEWGYAAVEAMVHGVPVIAFAVHPFREVLTPELGLLAGGPHATGLATALTSAFAGALPAREVVHRTATRRFGHRAIAERLVAAYEEVCR